MSFQIRRARVGDAAEIARVHLESWKTTYPGIIPAAYIASLNVENGIRNWQERLEEGIVHIFVAEDVTGIFGFVAGGAIREEMPPYDGELHAIYLLQSGQRNGAGSALTRALAECLHKDGLKAMLVWALDANPAVGFYKRLGAVPVMQKTINIGGADLVDVALGWPALNSLL